MLGILFVSAKTYLQLGLSRKGNLLAHVVEKSRGWLQAWLDRSLLLGAVRNITHIFAFPAPLNGIHLYGKE